MQDNGILIEEFIKQTMAKVELGLGDKYAVDGAVNFELSLGITNETKGNFNIKVLGIGRNVSDEAIQTVNFSVVSKESPDYEAQKLLMTKLKDFLSLPNEEILQFLQKNPKLIEEKKN